MARRRFPDSLVLIFSFVVLAQVATYVLPTGEFERDERRVIPGSYHAVDVEPLPAWTALTAVSRGMDGASSIIFLVFLAGGAVGVIRATGAIDALIGSAIRAFGKRPEYLLAGMTALLSLGAAAIGMAEEYVPFVPILVTMCLAMRLDSITAVGMVYVGAGIGYGCSAVNPFTVLIAQDVAGLPPTSGQGYRWLLLPLFLAIGVHHLLRYARRIRRDPRRSLVHDVDYSDGFALPDGVELGPHRVVVLATFVAGITVFVWGVGAHEWYLVELAAIFLGIALVSAVVGRLGANRTAQEFCRGAAELTTTALLIGFARAIQVVLDDGKVIDTVIHGIAGPLNRLGPNLAAIGMFAVQSLCNLFIPSGSGQAYVTMPIMAPLADLTGVTRQTAVLAYQFGDGLTNMIIPTNYVLLGMLGLARIPYQRWVRFIAPLILKLGAAAAVALVVAVAIEY